MINENFYMLDIILVERVKLLRKDRSYLYKIFDFLVIRENRFLPCVQLQQDFWITLYVWNVLSISFDIMIARRDFHFRSDYHFYLK